MAQRWDDFLVLCRRLIPLAVFTTAIVLWECLIWRMCCYSEGLARFLRDGHRALDLLTIDLATCGIFYAVRHDHHMRGQTGRLDEQLRELRSLEEQLSTRRKGSFPTYLSEIGELARTAEHLDVLVDCLDYGSFFLPHVHQKVHDEICSAAKRRVPVRMLVCGEIPEPFTGASGELFDKYPKPEDLLVTYLAVLAADLGFKGWVERLDSQINTDFEAFGRAWFKVPKPDAAMIRLGIQVCLGRESIDGTNSALRTTVLQIRQLWFAEELQRLGVQIRALPETEPMFFWLKHKEGFGTHITYDGLFTFAKAARGPSQLGYTTRDTDLLATFSATFTEKWDGGATHDPDWLKFLKKQCLL